MWQDARAVLPDATAEELYHFFHERARTVYRNRKLDNPTGLMLRTIHDWFSRRRVLERRKVCEENAREAVALQEQLVNQLAELRSLGVFSVSADEKRR
ncbi:MAG TPA: hypothetical protein VK638_58755 [Edaphobacter sp.]|nr:hypothetical protein [Edaphobacter sp.]